jgi:hypothetical protein
VLAYKSIVGRDIVDELNRVLGCSFKDPAVFSKAVDLLCLITGTDFSSRVTDDLIQHVFDWWYDHMEATLRFMLHFFTNGASHPDLRAQRVMQSCIATIDIHVVDATFVDLVCRILLALFAHLEATTVTTTVTRTTPTCSQKIVTETTPDKDYSEADAMNVISFVISAMPYHAANSAIQASGRSIVTWLVHNTWLPKYFVRSLGPDYV